MTGPEHYREAERLLESCQVAPTDGPDAAVYPEFEQGMNTCGNALAAAQVHATLALAAATALGSMRVDDHGMPPDDGNLWLQAASCTDWVHDD